MSGRFVHGGIQQSQLGKDGSKQYSEEGPDPRIHADPDYELKLAKAAEKVNTKDAALIIADAMQFRQKQRDKYNRMYGYDAEEERAKERSRERTKERDYDRDGRSERKSDRDRHSSRSSSRRSRSPRERRDRERSSRDYDRDRESSSRSSRQSSSRRSRSPRRDDRRRERDRDSRSSREDRYSSSSSRDRDRDRGRERRDSGRDRRSERGSGRGSERGSDRGSERGGMKREFEDFRNHEKYGTEFHSKYKWGGARLNNDKYATSSTGYRYVPRDPNSAIKSNEVKGWLHCWCQTKNLGKPEYEIEVFGKTPRQIFKVQISICNKRGEKLDIITNATASSKKEAMTAAAWEYVDQLVQRGILEADLAPKRSEIDEVSSGKVLTGNKMLTENSIFDEEKIVEGGSWTMASSMLRLNRFARSIRVPLNVDIDQSGPDHDRITVGKLNLRFHVFDEDRPRKYEYETTCRNKKQAKGMLSMAVMQELFKAGFVEKCGERGIRPPRVRRLAPEDGGFDWTNATDERGTGNNTGGWVEANSLVCLTSAMKFWGLDDEMNILEMGKTGHENELCFKAELRLVLTSKGRPVPQGAIPTVTSKIELYGTGMGPNKREAKGKCALMIVLQLYKYQVFGPSHMGPRPGPKAREFIITKGTVGSVYTRDDLAIMNKLNEIRPKPDELDIPNRGIAHIEAGLRLVSDWLHEEEFFQNRDFARKGKRTLIGIQRVGPIAMDLTLCNERRAHLVLTSGRRPTKQLLETISRLCPLMLEACENLHVPYKCIHNQKEAWVDRETDDLLASRDWTDVSDDTEEFSDEEQEEESEDEEPTAEEKAEAEEQVKVQDETQANMDAIFGGNDESTPAKAEAATDPEPKTDVKQETSDSMDTEQTEPKPDSPPNQPENAPEPSDQPATEAEPAQKENQSETGEKAETTSEMDVSTDKTAEPTSAADTAAEAAPEQAHSTETSAVDSIEADKPVGMTDTGATETQTAAEEPPAPEKSVESIGDSAEGPAEKTSEETPAENLTTETDTFKMPLPVKTEADTATLVAEPASETPLDRKMNKKERRARRAIRREALQKRQADFVEGKVNLPGFYKTKLELNNSGFLIHYGIEPPEKMIVRVTVTSTVLRSDGNATSFVKECGDFDTKMETQEEVLIDNDDVDNDLSESDDESVENDEPDETPEQIEEREAAEREAFKHGPYDDSIIHKQAKLIDSEGGLTPKQPALGALAELRRVRWFAMVGVNLPYLHDIVRLIRGLAIRETAWRSFRPLCPWIISLVTYNILKPEIDAAGGSTVDLSPVKALVMVLDAISKGFRFPVTEETIVKTEVKQEAGVEAMIDEVKKKSSSTKRYTHKLIDPCEPEGTDALLHIDSTRKSEIRACAKMALDLIDRKNCDLLLGVKVLFEALRSLPDKTM